MTEAEAGLQEASTDEGTTQLTRKGVPGIETAGYCDQSAAALRLSLLRGPVELAGFSVLEEKRINLTWIRVRAQIVGASHVLRFESGGFSAHEVFACADMNDETGCVFSAPVSELPASIEHAIAEGVRYRFRSRTVSLERGRAAVEDLESRIRAADALSPTATAVGLDFTFPSSDEYPATATATPQPVGTVAPRTLVWVQVDDASREVQARTAHSYPNEGSVVLSDSCLLLGSAHGGPGT